MPWMNIVTAKDIRKMIAEIGMADGGLNLKGDQLTEVNASKMLLDFTPATVAGIALGRMSCTTAAQEPQAKRPFVSPIK